MTLTPEQFAQLLAAIRAIAPDPVITTAVAIGSVAVGAVLGFLLSVAQTTCTARRQRMEARFDEIAVKRQSAIDQFGTHALQLVTAFQVTNPDARQGASDAIAQLFLQTGDPDDQMVWEQLRKYFPALVRNLVAFSYAEQDVYSNFVANYSRFTHAEQSAYEMRVKNLRTAAQTWIDRRSQSSDFANSLEREVRELDRIKPAPYNPAEGGP